MSQQAAQQTAASAATAARASVTVKAPIERAFEVFTVGFHRWWPPAHHLGEADLAEAVLEPRVGGRWYERTVDGKECDWGRVLAYEPPHRLVLSWAIQPDWSTRTDFDRTSTIEVSFAAVDEATTLVELEHRDLDRHGEGWQKIAGNVGSSAGWPGIMARYAELLAG